MLPGGGGGTFVSKFAVGTDGDLMDILEDINGVSVIVTSDTLDYWHNDTLAGVVLECIIVDVLGCVRTCSDQIYVLNVYIYICIL